MVKKKTAPKRKKVLSSYNDGGGTRHDIHQRVVFPNTANTKPKNKDTDGQDGPASSSLALSSSEEVSTSLLVGPQQQQRQQVNMELPPLPPLPPIGKFQKTERRQTNHKKELYCVAWSDDSYIKERPTTTTTGDEDNNNMEDGQQQEARYYVFATCGTNKVSIYEVQVNNNTNNSNENNNRGGSSNGSSNSGGSNNGGGGSGGFGMELLTCYTDNDTHEAFFACVFGGRSTLSYHQHHQNQQRNNQQNNHHSSNDDDDPQRHSHIDSSTRNFSGSSTSASTSNNNNSSTSNTATTTTTSSSRSSNNNNNDNVQTEVGRKRPRTTAESVTTTDYNPQLLCVAGQSGRIKVIDPVQGKIVVQLYGHGHDIYDLRVSPTNEYLLLSASVDESIRLWNLQSFACVAIFTGQHGHKEAV